MTKDAKEQDKSETKINESTTDAEGAMELKTPISARLKGKRMLVIIIVVVLALCGVAAYVISKVLYKNSDVESTEKSKEAGSTTQPVDSFYDMEEIVVNLAPTANQRHYLKMILSFRLATNKDNAVIENNLRGIQDSFHIFLKELRAQDFSGSGATMRLKEELTKRVNKVIYPVEVKDLLFKEILVD